ncbi:hypothetical protein PROFUN_12270 [Planoprotostelium fungivorum]|uniref:Right handed beta helix domain-containing protein n=1 Tax=Planoprotostelium fungivorum TaxID=1890364 RepID=A0A2P6N836_9EUKA|nr:hypothetical protein PROFUN_12270 [Planoprotostelium fungivorum]
MKRILLSLLLLYFVCIVLTCDTYVDSIEGDDVEGCGTIESPCRSISNHTSVCLATPGIYLLGKYFPPQMTSWSRSNASVSGEVKKDALSEELTSQLPTVNCSKRSYDMQKQLHSKGGPIIWNQVSIGNCDCTWWGVNFSDIRITQVSFFHSTLHIIYPILNDRDGAVVINDNNLTLSTLEIVARTSNHLEEMPLSVQNNLIYRSTVEVTSSGILFPYTVRVQQNTLSVGHVVVRFDWQVPPYSKIFVIANKGEGEITLEAKETLTVMTDASDRQYANLTVEENDVTRMMFQYENYRLGGTINVNFEGNQMNEVEMDLNTWSLNNMMKDNIVSDMSLKSSSLIRYLNNGMEDNFIDTLTFGMGIQDKTTLYKQSFYLKRNTFGTVYLAVQRGSGTTPWRLLQSSMSIEDNRWTQDGSTSALSIEGFQYVDMFITRNNVTGNRRSVSGAGIRIISAKSSHIIMSHNRASTGAAVSIMISNGNVTFSHNELRNNEATVSAGGLSIVGDNLAAIRVTECLMENNIAPHASAFDLLGTTNTTTVNNTIYADQSMSTDGTVAINPMNYNPVNRLFCPPQTRLKVTSTSWACSSCQGLGYLFEAGLMDNGQTNYTECKSCPDHVDCDGVTPQAAGGYWCTYSVELGVMKCYDCPDGYCRDDKHEWNDSCAARRTGTLCGECEEGYRPSLFSSACIAEDKCKRGYFSLIFLAPVVYLIFFSLLPVGDGSVLKSTSFFIQTVPLLTFLTFFISPGGSDGSSGFGLCVGQLNYVHKQLLILYIPVATVTVFGLACLISGILYHCRRRSHTDQHYEMIDENGDEEVREEEKRSVYSRCGVGMMTAYLLVYGGITSICLKLLFCVQIDGQEEGVLYHSGNIKCDSPWRIVLMIVAGVILLPSPFLIILLRRKLKARREQTCRDVRKMLDGCYRSSCKYWESVYMLRKLTISAVYVVGSYSHWGPTIMRSVLTFSLASHLLFQPFRTRIEQTLETVCLMSLTGLTILDTVEKQTNEAIVLEIVLIAVPLSFSGYLIVKSTYIGLKNYIVKKWKERKEKRSSEDEYLIQK